MIQSVLKVHHVHAEIQKSLGVDPCKRYKQSRVENVFARALPGLSLHQGVSQHTEIEKPHEKDTSGQDQLRV